MNLLDLDCLIRDFMKFVALMKLKVLLLERDVLECCKQFSQLILWMPMDTMCDSGLVVDSSNDGLCWREVCGRNDVHCNICLGDGFHPSSCTTPEKLNHMAGSAWEFDVRGDSGIQCGSAVATCSTAKSWKKELSRSFYGSTNDRTTVILKMSGFTPD